jgi:hypothetical protein
MPSKINSVNQNYNALDFQELQSDLELADVEELSERDFAVAKYKATGERPLRIAMADADTFGLKKAFWDVYSPVENPQTGRWIIEKDATSGDEFISLKLES